MEKNKKVTKEIINKENNSKRVKSKKENNKKNNKKDNKNLYIIISSIIALIFLVVIIILVINKKESEKKFEYYYLGNGNGIELNTDTAYILTNYSEFATFFKHDEITEKNFEDNNYALITKLKDSCSENNIKIEEYEVVDNVLKVSMSYEAGCGVCAPETIYYMVPVDKNIDNSLEVVVDYKARNNPSCQ